MSTQRTTDFPEYTLVEIGEPTVQNPTAWYSRDIVWKAGTPGFIEADLRSKASAALTANATYLALATPTVAQNTAQVQKLTRECNAIIRLLLGQLDSNTGT